MCGYDPFWLYDAMLDEEYQERTGYGLNTIDESGTGANDLRSDTRNDRQKITKEIDRGTK